MADRLKLLAVLLIVPAIGYAIATGIQDSNDSALREAAQRQAPDATPDQVASLTLAQLCQASADPATTEMCARNAGLTYMRIAALGAALAGLGLLVMIFVAGSIARANRKVLLTLFGPGIYFTAVVITGLIVVHAAIAVILLARVYLGASVMVGLGALAGIAAVARNAFSLVKKAEATAIGKPVSRAEAPDLWVTIDETAQVLSSLRPDHVVVGLDPTFYVTEANVTTLSGKIEGRTLFCSLPLARILTTAEFTAILGHELGHFRGEDTRFSERFYPIYRGTIASIQSLHSAGGQGWGRISLLPAMAVFNFFLEQFATAERAHSRTRELLADQAAASITSLPIIASALVKVHAFSGVWNEFQRAAVEAMKNGKMFINASAVYATTVADRVRPSSFDGIAEMHTNHPTDSHPTLSVRLHALGTTIDDVKGAASVVTPDDAAISLVADSERLERELSESYQLLLGHRLRIDTTAVKAQKTGMGVGKTILVRQCEACGTRVLPEPDRTCPRCGAALA